MSKEYTTKDTPSASGGVASSRPSVLERTPPVEVFQSHLELRRLPSVALLCVLSMVLLGISFAPFNCWYFAYVALVPWALAMAGGMRSRLTVLLGWACGAGFWAAMLYWLTLPTVGGYVAGVLYLSLYWLIASIWVRAAMRRNWPMWLALPILWVALEFARAHVISFAWFFLAQTQYQQTRLIQISDVTGQYGVSFFVAMVNGVVIDLLHSPLFVNTGRRVRLGGHIFRGLAAVVVAAAMLLGYGTWRGGQNTTSPGPQIGIVQEKFRISLDGPFTPPRTFLEYHIHRSMELIDTGCDLVLWPETMLPPGLNGELLALDVMNLDEDNVRSLCGCFLGPDIPGEHTVQQLRGFLLRKIGPMEKSRYYAPAARFVLSEFVQPGQLARLSPKAVSAMGVMLFGREKVQPLEMPAVRNLVGLYVAGSDGRDMNLRELQRAYNLIAPTAEGQGDWPDRESALRAVRQVIGRQLANDDAGRSKTDTPALDTLKCQACMVDVCSYLLDCPILAGGTGYHRNDRPTGLDDIWVLRNDVLIFGRADPARIEYSKIHLVPFSEYVPWKYSWNRLHRLLRGFVPRIMPQLDPGSRLTRFPLRRAGGDWLIVTPVCFEGTFARLCRRMVAAGPKDRLILANLSNDGWFVHPARGNRPPGGTTEQAQHLVHSVFRAIENRVPVVRAVNTGISAVINSNGRIESVIELKLEEYRQATMVAGTLRRKILVDSRLTVYSLYGDIFAAVSSAIAAVMTAWLVWKARKSRRGKQD